MGGGLETGGGYEPDAASVSHFLVLGPNLGRWGRIDWTCYLSEPGGYQTPGGTLGGDFR
jgi:hypothetical protein